MIIKRARHNQRRGMSLIYGFEPQMMITQLALALQLVRDQMVADGVHVMTLCRCMRYEGYSATVENEVKK